MESTTHEYASKAVAGSGLGFGIDCRPCSKQHSNRFIRRGSNHYTP